METKIDGNYTVAETQSSVNLTESIGYKLISLDADDATSDNMASFEEAEDIIQTSLIEITGDKNCGSKGPPPAGQWVCCSDQVYISGIKKPVGAYR